jgi:hypothetical protein
LKGGIPNSDMCSIGGSGKRMKLREPVRVNVMIYHKLYRIVSKAEHGFVYTYMDAGNLLLNQYVTCSIMWFSCTGTKKCVEKDPSMYVPAFQPERPRVQLLAKQCYDYEFSYFQGIYNFLFYNVPIY